MKSLRVLAHVMMVLLSIVLAVPATASGSADEPMKPKSSGGDKAGSKKEKAPKKNKIDKIIDEVDEAQKKPAIVEEKQDKEEKKSKSEKNSEESKGHGDSDYEGTYKGTYTGMIANLEIDLKIEKAKKGPLYSAEGHLKWKPEPDEDDDEDEPYDKEYRVYKIEGTFYPKSGKLIGDYKASSKNARGEGNIEGNYKDGELMISIGGLFKVRSVKDK